MFRFYNITSNALNAIYSITSLIEIMKRYEENNFYVSNFQNSQNIMQILLKVIEDMKNN
jgi:hypothetical protein